MHLRYFSRRKFFTVSTLSLCSLAIVSGQEFRSYVGESGGTWESPTNWDPNLVPDTITEGARVSGARVNVGSTTVIDTLEILGSGGVVMNQQNELRTNKLLTAGGGLFGTGTVQIMQSGSMSGSIGHTWDQLTVINNGVFELKDLTLANSPLVENKNTMIFDDGDEIGDTNMIGVPEPLPTTFINTGFLRKETGTGTAVFTARFESAGEIFSQDGTLDVRGGGTNTGAIRTEDKGVVRLSGRMITFGDGSSIFGTGTTKLSSGYLFSAPGVTVPVNNFTMEQTQSRMGGEGSFELSGNDLLFSGGQLIDNVTVRIKSGASLEVSGGIGLDDSALLINEAGSTITMTSASANFTNSGITTFQNFGTIEIEGDGDLTNNGPFNEFSFMTLQNDGLIDKTAGTSSSIFSHVMENNGEISSRSGTIQINSTGVNRGIFSTEGTAVIRISTNDLVFEDGSSITGTGLTKLSSGYIKAAAGAAVSVNNFLSDQGGSRLGGDGEFQLIGNDVTFTGGRLLDNVTVRVLDGSSLDIAGGFSLTDNPTIINDENGLITFSQSGSNLFNSGLSTLRNEGTILFANDGDINSNGPVSQFSNIAIENNGTILKNGGTGDSFLAYGSYTGTGLLRIETGTIRLSGISGVNELTGSVVVLSGATLRGSRIYFEPGSMVSGGGTLQGSFIYFRGTTAPGMSIGTLAVNGRSVFEETASFDVELGQGTADQLQVTSDATIDGDLVISLDGGVVPFDGDSWTILTASTVTGIFDSIIAPAATEGFGYFVDYNPNSVTVHYEFIGFRRAVEQALGIAIPANADLDDYVGLDSDGDGKSDLLEWALGTDIGTADSQYGLEVTSFDEQTPQTVRFRAPANPLALDVILELEVADSPEGTYSVLSTTPLDGQDEVIDGVLYQSFEAQVPGGSAQSRFFRLTARLGDL